MKDYIELLRAAGEWATKAHERQRYGIYPYTHHLKDVYATLTEFGYDPDKDEQSKILAVGAWLHDIIEDTPATYEEVCAKMGKEIADLVYAVTDEPGKNRKERHEKTYPKIKAHPYAVILKLADRISNIHECVRTFFDNDKFSMYLKEYPDFRSKLKTEGVADAMWAHLDRLMGDPKFAFTVATAGIALTQHDQNIMDKAWKNMEVSYETWAEWLQYKLTKSKTSPASAESQ